MASHRGRAFWSGQVAAFQGSGLSRAAYSRQHGLDYKTFQRWVRRVAAEASEIAGAQALVPLRVSTPSQGSGGMLRLEVGAGVVLAIPRPVDARWVAELLRAVAC